MSSVYNVKNLRITQKELSFEVSGSEIRVPFERTGSKVLPETKTEYLQIFEIDEDGIGIHWPVIDEDLSIEGLLRSAGREDLIVKEIPSLYLDEDAETTDAAFRESALLTK